MRTNLRYDRGGWLYTLDYRKVIIIAFILRLLFAGAYDIFVTLEGRDVLLPDGSFYSMHGRHIASLLNGYDDRFLTAGTLPRGGENRAVYLEIVNSWKNRFSPCHNENQLYFYVIAIIYFIFGYFPLAVRVFNIVLSMGSVFFLFMVARRRFGDLAANIFLLIALFLPTQVGYSIMLSKDFMRVFVISLILWVIYG